MTSDWKLPLAEKSNIKAMRHFSFGFSGLLVIVFGFLLPFLFSNPYPYWPFIVAGCLSLCGLLFPQSVYPIYRVWMTVASVVAWINTRLIMLVTFFVLIFPLGLVLRAMKKLEYAPVSWQNKGSSYWKKRKSIPTAKNLKEPF